MWKKRPLAKEINDVEAPRTANEHVAQNWFRCFMDGDINLKDKFRSEKPVVKDEALLQMVENPSRSTHTLSEELGPS